MKQFTWCEKTDLKPWQSQKWCTPTVIGTWESERNATRATIDWRLKIPNARDKLKKLYPVRKE